MADQHPATAVSRQRPGWWYTWCGDGWSSLRNRLLASPRFQHWSSRLLPTRPIARQQAQALFDLCAGFVYSQVLYACVQLRLLEAVQQRPQSLPALAQQLSLGEDKAAILLDAAVALTLLEQRRHGRYGLGPLGAVVVGNAGIQAMIRHHALFYADLDDPVALLRGELTPTRLASYWPYATARAPAALTAAEVGAYSRLMAESQTLVAEQVLDSYSLGHHRCLLDVGGGLGSFLTAVAARWSHLQLQLFDLPAVVEQAGRSLAATGMASRVRTWAGNFLQDALPQGADVISLIRIIHDHDDAAVLQLLRSIRSSLPAAGTLLLAEPMAGDQHTDKAARAYFGFYLLAMGSGRPRTPEQIGGLLNQAGFRRFRLLNNRMPMQTRVMIARP